MNTANDELDDARPVLFEPEPSPGPGIERWRPTDYARGPWNRDHCHGGPPSALLARACERVADPDDPVDWQVARLTIELTRPVPAAGPLDVVAAVERPGRKVSLVTAVLRAGDVDVARVRAQRIRREPLDLPPHPRPDDEMTGEPGAGRIVESNWTLDGGGIAFHRSACEHRWIEGGWNEHGPCKVWIRLLADIVPGETPTGVQRAAAAADFGNGVSGALDAEILTYINPDLSIHLARPPSGEWIGLAAHSVYGTATESSGAGFAESALHDELGRVGRSVQSLIVQAP